MTVVANFTPEVKRLADEIRELTLAEMLALQVTLREHFEILPPDIGVREPAPKGPTPTLDALAKADLP